MDSGSAENTSITREGTFTFKTMPFELTEGGSFSMPDGQRNSRPQL